MKYVNKIWDSVRRLKIPLNKRNWRAIVLCLITAFIFWVFNSLNKEYTTRLDYPVQYSYNRDSLISVTPLPSKIPVNVSGGGWNLLRITLKGNADPVIVDLGIVRNNRFLTQYNLLPIISDQLSELTINFVGMDTLFYSIEDKIEKKLLVKVDTNAISIAEDYLIDSSIRLTPDSVIIIGPKSIMEKIDDEIVLTIPDIEIDRNFDEQIPVVLSSSAPMESIPPNVNVQFECVQITEVNRNFMIETMNFPEGENIGLFEEFVAVKFKLPVNQQDDIDEMEFSIIADYNNLIVADSTIDLEIVKIPDHIFDFNLSKSNVKVQYVN